MRQTPPGMGDALFTSTADASGHTSPVLAVFREQSLSRDSPPGSHPSVQAQGLRFSSQVLRKDLPAKPRSDRHFGASTVSTGSTPKRRKGTLAR